VVFNHIYSFFSASSVMNFLVDYVIDARTYQNLNIWKQERELRAGGPRAGGPRAGYT